MSRYDKNAASVRKVCKILGYSLVGYDPNWSIAVDKKLPNSRLEIVANQMRGQYDQISDELMGRIALIMGLDWIFEIDDDELRKLIDQFNGKIKDTEGQFESKLKIIERSNNDKNKIDDFKKDYGEYVKEIKIECNEKIQYFEDKLKFREKLRGFLKSKGV